MDDLLGTATQNLDKSRASYLASIKSAPELENALQSTIREVFNPDVMKLAQNRGAAAKAYSIAPAQVDEMYGAIENPTERRRLSSDYIGGKLQDFVTATTLSDTLGGSLGGLLGRVKDILAQQQKGYADQYSIAQDAFDRAQETLYRNQELAAKGAATRSSALEDFLKPYQEAKPDVLDASDAIRDIDRALELLRSGIKTGQLSGRALKFKTQTSGNASEAERELYNIISDVGIERLVDLGGKVLPAKELELFTQSIPRYTKPTETNISDLVRMRETLSRGVNNAIGGLYNMPSNFQWDPEDLNRVMQQF